MFSVKESELHDYLKTISGNCKICNRENSTIPCPIRYKPTEIIVSHLTTTGKKFLLKDMISTKRNYPNIYRQTEYIFMPEVLCSKSCLYKRMEHPLYEETEILLKRIGFFKTK